ncbi:MAG: hypothetical protein HUU32_11535 [Calditrichaceae bacterium]|nr:hypothetical protein [Calditrichia bacterium]NUQ42019.1 hypothetical protein [Calditrichaceae bacterium]
MVSPWGIGVKLIASFAASAAALEAWQDFIPEKQLQPILILFVFLFTPFSV